MPIAALGIAKRSLQNTRFERVFCFVLHTISTDIVYTAIISMKRVLIIDDNDAILKSVGLLLRSKHFDVITHNGSGDVTRFVCKEQPDVILLDYLLSGKNGAEIVRQFKKYDMSARIPVIAVSAHPSAHLQMAQEGVYTFIQKPFDSDTVIAKIDQALRRGVVAEEARSKS